ncbi:MAG: isoprenylcysteine carboxyl methyltransferase [Myxococcota bacterium]|nr:isoprenylcysteine carboxyl methyltransferase [Myxococcota bacterium]
MADKDARGREPRLPASVTSFRLNLVALGALLGSLYFLRQRHLSSMDDMLLLLASVSVPVILLDVLVLRVHRRASAGLEWDKPNPPAIARVATKILGLLLTLALIALAYWVFPEYHGSFYEALYAALRRFWLSLTIVAVTYLWFVDGLMREPRDAYWQLGRVVLGHPCDARKGEVANHFRGWLVKAYFFPLMFVWLHNSVHELIHFDLTTATWSNLRVYDFLYTLVFGVDLLFTTAGYALSMKVIDTHIRSAEPTMLGWAVALFCYQPFFSLMDRQYVAYGGGAAFGPWLSNWPTVRSVWAVTILALLSMYSLATVAFGVRFSNLTHRGILTGGPYRFSKHPAYITKNLSWWLISVPFVHAPPGEAVRHSLLLGCINTIYFLRARTEERHLSRDPDYVAYAIWMNEHGLLRFVGRWIPLLRYKPPARQPLPAAVPTTVA